MRPLCPGKVPCAGWAAPLSAATPASAPRAVAIRSVVSISASLHPAGVELLELTHLVRVRPVPVLAGNLEDRRQPLQLRMAHEDAELLAHQAVPDVVVAVAVRAERRLGVVDVQRAEPLESDRPVHVREWPVESLRVGDVVPRGVQMAGVEA